MSDNLETIKSRIAKMLATASNDASTPNEKATAMQMANALMRRYNLERDDIEDINKKENYGSENVNSLWARMTPWESSLAAFVSAYVVKGSWVVASKVGGSNRNYGSMGQAIMTFVGLGDDPKIAVATFNQLRDSLLCQCEALYGTPVRGKGRSYAVGFVDGLFDTAREAERLEKENAEIAKEISRALIRTDLLKEQAKNWYMIKEDMKLKSTKRRLSVRPEAYNAGFYDGKNASQKAARPAVGLLN